MPRRKNPNPRPNRTDLTNAPQTLTPRNRPYGSRRRFEEAASTPESAAGLSGTHATAGSPAPTDQLAAALAALGNPQPVGLANPSSRPDEPVTAGLSRGPGPGPEAIPGLVRQGPPPDVSLWVPYLPMLELLASRPDASTELRQFYRRLRSQMPADPFTQPGPG